MISSLRQLSDRLCKQLYAVEVPCENLEKRGINMKDSQNKGQKEPKEVIWGLMWDFIES